MVPNRWRVGWRVTKPWEIRFSTSWRWNLREREHILVLIVARLSTSLHIQTTEQVSESQSRTHRYVWKTLRSDGLVWGRTRPALEVRGYRPPWVLQLGIPAIRPRAHKRTLSPLHLTCPASPTKSKMHSWIRQTTTVRDLFQEKSDSILVC